MTAKLLIELEKKRAEIQALKRKINRLELENAMLPQIQIEIAKYNYEDATRDGAFYFMKKITDKFFPNAPIGEFERRKYFQKKLSNYEKNN
jgi:hypothetical protein